jgi:hypothetical protein
MGCGGVQGREHIILIRRFLRNRIDFRACVTGLEAALTRSMPDLSGDQMETLRAHLLSNGCSPLMF